MFKILGQLQRLKKLNLSRNRYFKFHGELCDPSEDFVHLTELEYGFNMVEDEHHMWFITLTRSLTLVNITGNPFAAIKSRQHGYMNLEAALQKNLSATVINDLHLTDGKAAFTRKKAPKQVFPYPNPIKLLSRDANKEVKGDYLNAEVMRKGIALPISDIRPNTNIYSEIFPKELTREAQSKDVFTPPNHQQMRFDEDEVTAKDHENFFITGADVDQQNKVAY